MEPRKFAVSERVKLDLERYRLESPDDVHEISRLLPAQGGIWQYRVKRVGDAQ